MFTAGTALTSSPTDWQTEREITSMIAVLFPNSDVLLKPDPEEQLFQLNDDQLNELIVLDGSVFGLPILEPPPLGY